MYKYLCTTIVLAMCSMPAFAQQKPTKTNKKETYMRIGVGYNIPSSAQRSIYNTPLNGSLNYSSYGLGNYDLKKASFTAGLQANIAVGIMLNKHVGLELNNVVGIASIKYLGIVQYPDNGYAIKQQNAKRASATYFAIPSLVLQYGDKVQLYTRTGMILPVVSRIKNEFSQTATYINNKQSISGTEVLKHRFNLGLSASVGIKGRIGKGVNGWLELNYTSLSLNTSKAELKEYYVNGQDMMNRMTNTTQKYSNTNTGVNNVFPTNVNPYSSMGLHLGIAFEL